MVPTLMDKLPGRSRRLVALDWDTRTFNAVEATVQKSGLRINRVISASIPEDVKVNDVETFAPYIRQVLADKKFTTRQVLLAVPREKVILVNLRLPEAPVGDLSNMVRLQAARELPFSADEAVMDFAGSKAHDAPEFLDVTVAAIQREALAYYQKLASAAGLSLVRLGLRPNSNLVSVIGGVQPFPDDRILFVDIAPQTTEINIFRWGRLTYSRSVHINAEAGGAADEAASRPVLMEVLRTVEAYRTTDHNKIDQIIVAGDTGQERWLADALRTRLSSPASLYDPRWTVEIDKDRAEQMTGFAAVLGLLAGQLSPEIGRFDFASPKKPLDMAAIRRRQIITATAAAAVLLFGAWLASASYVGQLDAQKAAVQAEIDKLQVEASKVDLLDKRIETARKWMNQDLVWIDQLRNVVQRMPDNTRCYVTKLSARANSSEGDDARELQVGLRMSDGRIPSTIQDELMSNTDFRVTIGASRQSTRDARYDYTGELTIVIPGKLAGSVAQPKAPASQPAEVPAAPPVAGEDDQTSTVASRDRGAVDGGPAAARAQEQTR